MTPQGRTDLGVLQEVSDFLKASSESLLDIVMANAISSYLEKHVEPHVGKVAHNMAVGVFHLLWHFLSSKPTGPHQGCPVQHSQTAHMGTAEVIADFDEDNSPAYSPLSSPSPQPTH